MTQRHIDQLMSALAAEGEALQTANYDALDDLRHQIAALMDAVSKDDHPATTLQLIKAKVENNQSLLRAAISGVSAARDRVEALRQVQSGLSVYDQSGTLATVPRRVGGLEKKA